MLNNFRHLMVVFKVGQVQMREKYLTRKIPVESDLIRSATECQNSERRSRNNAQTLSHKNPNIIIFNGPFRRFWDQNYSGFYKIFSKMTLRILAVQTSIQNKHNTALKNTNLWPSNLSNSHTQPNRTEKYKI